MIDGASGTPVRETATYKAPAFPSHSKATYVRASHTICDVIVTFVD